MKKYALILTALFVALTAQAQKFEEYKDIKLREKEDFYVTEEKVIECASYILTCKMEDPSQSRQNAVDFMLRWATKAPYDFIIQEWVYSLMKQNNGYLVVQMAALIKFQLANKEASADDIQTGAAMLVYNYIKDPQFRVEQKGYVKKFVAAGDAGTLAAFIKK
jgi:hypothetical protein